MPRKKKIAIGVTIFLIIGALVGIGLGLYFHFRPGANHVQTVVSTTNDGATTYSSTKFVYFDNNMIGDSVNQTFTLMVAGLNASSSTQQRNLQGMTSQNSDSKVDLTLHYTHDSGIQIKFRGN